MKLHSHLTTRTGSALLCGLLLSAGICANRARADQWDKKTILTVRNEPIQIRETVLEPGQYVLRLLDSQSERHVVQIFNSDQSHIINTVIAVPATRLQPTGETEFTFWETPPGMAKAMRRWYYPGDNMGQEFPYPKHLQQVAMLERTMRFDTSAANTTAESNGEYNAQSMTSEPTTSESTTQPQTTEMAQNTTPATPSYPSTTEPSTTSSAPSTTTVPERSHELPKTGSPYALIGLAGGALLGLFALLRLWARQVG